MNYNFLLHFYDISNSEYKNLENYIINFKNKNINIKKILDKIKEDDYMYIINNILLSSNFEYIAKGIFSDRDLMKFLNIDEIFKLLDNNKSTSRNIEI